MTVPKKHHFIPEFLLKRFVNADKKLFVFDKSKPRMVFQNSPKKLFIKKNLNSYINEDGSVNVELEQKYQRLETKASPIIVKIDELAQFGKKPQLNNEERKCWDEFFYHQLKRAPDIFKKLGILDQIKKEYEIQVCKDLKLGEIKQRNKDYLLSQKGIYRLIQTSSVLARGSDNKNILFQVSQLGLLIGVINQKNKSFIMGDYPIMAFEEDATISFEKNLDLWMPISSTVAVAYNRNCETEQLICLSGDQVRKINNRIYKK